MRKMKQVFIVMFFILLMVPVITFDREKDAVSEIDNRMLAENPFTDIQKDGEVTELTASIENYVNDRIGLRSDMIRIYVTTNNKLFHKMVHPSYVYGKDDYVFLNSGGNLEFWDFHVAFADMVAQIQSYCEERNVPFLFVFDPAKTTVLQDELEEGWNYNNEWAVQFKDELDKRNIHYIDNTDLLTQKTEHGEVVFNKQYDAGHWNDLGAFYGVNHMLEALQEEWPAVHINSMDEFEIGERVETKLPLSEIPIHETVPEFISQAKVVDLTEEYKKEIILDKDYNHFKYYINEERKQEGSPKVLVFQGSYLNEKGEKFLQNSLGEYIAIHNYRNIFNFDYYYQIFKPECVIFEVAEYTMTQEYFPYEEMKKVSIDFPCPDSVFEQY